MRIYKCNTAIFKESCGTYLNYFTCSVKGFQLIKSGISNSNTINYTTLRSNQFNGPISCPTNIQLWPIHQPGPYVDLCKAQFSGYLGNLAQLQQLELLQLLVQLSAI